MGISDERHPLRKERIEAWPKNTGGTGEEQTEQRGVVRNAFNQLVIKKIRVGQYRCLVAFLFMCWYRCRLGPATGSQPRHLQKDGCTTTCSVNPTKPKPRRLLKLRQPIGIHPHRLHPLLAPLPAAQQRLPLPVFGKHVGQHQVRTAHAGEPAHL